MSTRVTAVQCFPAILNPFYPNKLNDRTHRKQFYKLAKNFRGVNSQNCTRVKSVR